MFRKDRKMVKAWEEHGPEYFCKIQKDVILKAASMLKPGGMMLYSTCTFDGRENEQVIGWLLEQYPAFQILEITPYEGFCQGIPEMLEEPNEELRKTVRIFPHKMKGEGHYLALLKKGESDEEVSRAAKAAKEMAARSAKGAKIPGEAEEFFQDVSFSLDVSRLDIRGERLYYMPEGLPDLRGIRFLRTGLLLGELKKNRFEPSQALAMYLRKEDYRYCIDFTAEDERVIRYLKGETISADGMPGADGKGWRLVCVDGYPLGFAKLGNGVLKNKYLPGWRLCG